MLSFRREDLQELKDILDEDVARLFRRSEPLFDDPPANDLSGDCKQQ